MNARLSVKAAFLGTLLAMGFADKAHAEFMIVDHSAKIEPTTLDIRFTLAFNEVPDFTTVDSSGRQANSFQIYIVGDPSLPYPQNFDSIVRGEEIHVTSDTVPILNAYPPVVRRWKLASDPRRGPLQVEWDDTDVRGTVGQPERSQLRWSHRLFR